MSKSRVALALVFLVTVFGTACNDLIGNDEYHLAPPVEPGVDAGSASLVSLSLSRGELSPAFSPEVTEYTATVGVLTYAVQVTASASGNTAVSVIGHGAETGKTSALIPLELGERVIEVTAGAGAQTTRTYRIRLIRDRNSAVQTYVKATNTGPGDDFGTSVAIAGDTLEHRIG